MRWVRVVPAVAVVIVLVVAFIGYERYIPIHHVERGRLSRLVVTAPPAGFKAKPAVAEIAASSSPYAALKTAAAHSPNATGSYSAQWTGSAASTDVASLLASWLPNAADAATVQRQAAASYLAPGSFKTDSYTLLSHFSVPKVAGAEGVTFGPAAAKGATPRLAVVVFRQGRTVVLDYAQRNSPAQAVATATALAQVENTHLQQVGSTFTLKVTHYPLVASLIYAGVAVALVALVVLVPIGVSRGRRHRRLAREAAARRALQGRGHKIAKHQAARHR